MTNNAFEEGKLAKKLTDNPYWTEYPRPAKGGPEEETKARRWVDGFLTTTDEERTK